MKKTLIPLFFVLCCASLALARESTGSDRRSSAYFAPSGGGSLAGQERSRVYQPTPPVIRAPMAPAPSLSRSQPAPVSTPSPSFNRVTAGSGSTRSLSDTGTRTYTPPPLPPSRAPVQTLSRQPDPVGAAARTYTPSRELPRQTVSRETVTAKPETQPPAVSREPIRTPPVIEPVRSRNADVLTRPETVTTPVLRTAPTRDFPRISTPLPEPASTRDIVTRRREERELPSFTRDPISNPRISAPADTLKRDTGAGLSRILTPESRVTTPPLSRGTYHPRSGTADTRALGGSDLTASPLSLRSVKPGADLSLSPDTRGIITGKRSSRPAAERERPAMPPSSLTGARAEGRYGDGKYAIRQPPLTPFRANPGAQPYMNHNPSGGHGGGSHHHHHPTSWFDPWTFRHCHNAFSPVWYGPVVYPVSGFGFGWGSGFGLSFYSFSCAPAYYYATRYYDSWYNGGWGCSGVYYGGWRHGWYGGFSYVYNPWPVYRTYYLYDPYPPVVTRTETVYVTQPATTSYVVESPVVTTTTGLPVDVTTTIQPAEAAPAAPAVWEAAPAAERVETAAAGCFCPCRCNGQRPCTCDYPCGAEYAVSPEAFDLELAYASYAESLDPETIWTSYAGLDRWDSDDAASLYETTASTGSTPR